MYRTNDTSFSFIRKRKQILVDIVNKLTVLFSVKANGAVSRTILSTVIAKDAAPIPSLCDSERR